MFSMPQNVFILVATLVVALSFTLALNRVWPCERRRDANNELVGWQLNILGTTYAVILGFMLYQVWTTFGAANLNVDLEANSLRNTYRLAQGLPEPQRDQLEAEAQAYADAVIQDDWPAMANGRLPEESHEVNEKMWQTLMSIKGADPSQIIAEDHALSELSDMTAHRRSRLLESQFHLPIIFWAVLLIGGALTLLSVAMFGSAHPKLHALQVFSITLLITLAMLAISDVNRPFQGWVHVSNYAFIRAQQNMHSY